MGRTSVAGAPSSVMTDPDRALPSGDAASATSQACSCSRPSRCSGNVRAAARHNARGTCASDSVSKWPAASARTADAVAAPLLGGARAYNPRPLRARRLEWVMPARPWWGEEVTLNDRVPPP